MSWSRWRKKQLVLMKPSGMWYYEAILLVPMKQVQTSMVKTIGPGLFQNKSATFIAIHQSRGHKAIESIIPEGLPKSVLVTDCWPAYFNVEARTHQLCTAHLLRELVFLKDKYPLDQWAQQFSQLITDSLSLRKENRATKNKVDKVC